MLKFIVVVKGIAKTIAIVTGLVAAIAAAMEAFTKKMKEAYKDDPDMKDMNLPG